MTGPAVAWWTDDHDRLRRALAARLRASGHHAPDATAALIATRAVLSLDGVALVDALRTQVDAALVSSERRRHELRDLLNEWDPIDDVDCLLEGLILRVERGDASDAIVAYLHAELRHHFGLDPRARDVSPFVARVLAWHRRNAGAHQ